MKKEWPALLLVLFALLLAFVVLLLSPLPALAATNLRLEPTQSPRTALAVASSAGSCLPVTRPGSLQAHFC
jgi:hypothetical protein